MRQAGKALDLVRRAVDDAMIFASLTMLAWPVLFGGQVPVVLATGLVGALAVGAILLTLRWPLLRYAPVAAAVIMATYWHARHGHVTPGLTWLLIVVSAIILLRQFLGART